MHTVWYTFTSITSGFAQGFVDANQATGLAVYTGSELSNLTQIGCWGWRPDNVIFDILAGETYYIQVGSLKGKCLAR